MMDRKELENIKNCMDQATNLLKYKWGIGILN